MYSHTRYPKKSWIPSELFREQAIMSRLEKLYSDKGEGTSRAINLANNLRLYPISGARALFMDTEDPKTYNKFLSHYVMITSSAFLLQRV